MRIAIEGCAHGELDRIYDSIRNLEESHSDPDFKVDLLLICGDFQAMRNQNDLACLACPPKYRSMNSFYKYYSGEKVAPILTIFIGGNHEASNYMQELHFGGWVAPRIYYLGCSGVVKVGGIRIAGLSGIYNGNHFKDGHWERPPYSAGSLRSVYHLRELEVFKMCLYHRILDAKETSQTVDIFLSHDWPQGITRFGDEPTLLQKKRFLVKEVRENTLGSPPAMYLLQLIKPVYWFSAHMHVKFPALVPHIIQPTTTIDVSDQPAAAIPPNDPNSSLAMQDERHSSAQPSSSNSAQQSSSDPVSVPQTFSNSAAVEPCTSEQVTNSCEQSQNTITPPSSSNGIQNNLGEQQQQIHNPDGRKCTTTRFLALDKCLPRRQFLQVIEIQRKDGKEENSPLDIEYDLDWLVVLKATNPLSVPSRKQVDLPSLDTYQKETLASYRVEIENRIGSSRIAENFTATVPSHNSTCNDRSVQPTQMGNPCTDRLLGMLEIPHTGITVPYESRPDEIVTENDPNAPVVADDNEIDIDDV